MRHHPGNRRPDVRRFGQGPAGVAAAHFRWILFGGVARKPSFNATVLATVRRRAAGKTSCISICGKPFSQSLSGEGSGEALLKVASRQTLELG